MIAMLGIPTGRLGGLLQKRHGAARTSTRGVWPPNPMTATLGTPIGVLDGLLPRRHGAARTSTWGARESCQSLSTCWANASVQVAALSLAVPSSRVWDLIHFLSSPQSPSQYLLGALSISRDKVTR